MWYKLCLCPWCSDFLLIFVLSGVLHTRSRGNRRNKHNVDKDNLDNDDNDNDETR